MEICSKNKDQAKSFEQGRGIETCLSTERAKMKSKKVRNNEPFFPGIFLHVSFHHTLGATKVVLKLTDLSLRSKPS